MPATSTDLSLNVNSRSVLGAWNSAAHSAVLMGPEKGRRMGDIMVGGYPLCYPCDLETKVQIELGPCPEPPVLHSSIPVEAPICLRLTSGGEMEGLKNLRIL